ncbi:DUF4232 domain-containing protein [Streptomyces naganishii]|uniref:DUF4232 domain-containing protein n=1 Tax=Streptomyces naganishii JCM 4654 TaxID=1306179 RepID=A0A919CW14_9ACTN|nr:DUF4232 domain-containing protein [Streptomyces naganishii]GHD91143.1 hypothetical protein GCM10010508_38980 [Streptomyces naganishii JCM 4654]
MARRTAALSAISLAVVLAVTACGPAHHEAGPRPSSAHRTTASAGTPTPTTSPTGTTSATPRPTPTTASPSSPAGTPHAAPCRSGQLRWTLTRLDGKPGHGPATALLSAANTAARPCALHGYPYLEAHVGKGPAVWTEPGTKARVRVLLRHGHPVVFPLTYPASPDRHGYCAIPTDLDPVIVVRPPNPARTDYGTPLRMTDTHGRPVRPVFCDTIRIGPPRQR